MSKTPLTQNEYDAVKAAIHKKPYDKIYFKRGVQKINIGSAARPSGYVECDFPWLVTEWRKDIDWSIAHLDRHQEACKRAEDAYWEVMKESDKGPETMKDKK